MLQFKWQIMIARSHMQVCMVMHELFYLIRHFYSREFLRELDRVMCDYQHLREWLIKSAPTLSI